MSSTGSKDGKEEPEEDEAREVEEEKEVEGYSTSAARVAASPCSSRGMSKKIKGT